MKIVIYNADYKIVKEYDFLIPLSKSDYLTLNGIDYQIDCVLLNVDDNKLEVHLK